MKTAAFAMALMLGGAAIAQTTQPVDSELTADPTATSTATDMDSQTTVTEETTAPTTMDTTTQPQSTAQPEAMATNMTPASGSVVQPSNADPEHDARGIKVISAEAMVPAGWNGTTGTAQGGPLLDPATGEAMAPDTYPACSATVTDNCLQSYERGRSA